MKATIAERVETLERKVAQHDRVQAEHDRRIADLERKINQVKPDSGELVYCGNKQFIKRRATQ